LALAALPDDALLAFNIRAFSPDNDCATRLHRRRVPHERKKSSAASLHLVSICISRLGTYVEQLDYLVGAGFVSEGHHGDERICTVGDSWERAIRDVIAGPTYCLTG
jgi:hypothetical protein